ncbi:MAG TPA: hypothetical protein VMX14_13220 [Anaerolineae bacterium]|nr:hypothetical protein [Anaerolineae bacterium]
MNTYYKCRNCNQVVHGFEASQHVACCDHPDYEELQPEDETQVTIQQLAAQALIQYRTLKADQDRQHDEKAAQAAVDLAKRVLGIEVTADAANGAATLDGLTFRSRHDPESMADYLEVTADGWGAWECVCDLAGLGKVLERPPQRDTHEYAPGGHEPEPPERIAQALELIAKILNHIDVTLQCSKNYMP